MSKLRGYQAQLKQEIFNEWNAGNRNVLAVSPTGSGKTVLFADIVNSVNGVASAVIAHRAELVSQMSMALAREGVRHRIIGPDRLRRTCIAMHMQELGRTLHDPGARVGACGVDTLVNKNTSNDSWFRQVGLWVQDEAHHVLTSNKWGRAAEMFPNAWGLGVTATPLRADGKGLGASTYDANGQLVKANDGLFHAMVQGPSMRDLIDQGYLTDYRIFAPPSDVDYSSVTVTGSGDYSPAKLSAAVHASDTFVGDVVAQYKQISMRLFGRLGLGITFAVDVPAARELKMKYDAEGVPAEVVTADTDPLVRVNVLRRFKAGQVKQLVNVDLFGEGFDLPAVEIVSMARKTESFSLFVQQFGRMLRLLVDVPMPQWELMLPASRLAAIAASAKPRGVLIDHVGNVIRHGLPDALRNWSLDPRSSRSSGANDEIPLRNCPNPDTGRSPGLPPRPLELRTPCASVYERYRKVCPFCQFYPEPAERSAPAFVDGDLYELDPRVLEAMRGQKALIDGAPTAAHVMAAGLTKATRVQAERYETQRQLRGVMEIWGGWRLKLGHTDSEMQRQFFHQFKIDVLSAQALGKPEAEALMQSITNHLVKKKVTTL